MASHTPNLRVLVVDDSSLYRKIVREVLDEMTGVEVVGTAHNGVAALQKLQSLKPDVITLDLEMPELDGTGVLQELSESQSRVGCIMVSALTASGAQATTTALRLGAFDFVLKPTASSLDQSVAQLKGDLGPKLEAYRKQVLLDRHLAVARPGCEALDAIDPRRSNQSPSPPEIIGIGVSTGGPQALTQLLPQLPADLPCPVVLVQHMPPLFTKSLAEDLDAHCALTVVEAEEGQRLAAGTVYVAPGGKQMRLLRIGSSTFINIVDDPPENNCKPSVDYLFRSISVHFGSGALGVILTGMGEDGAAGCRLLKDKGATIFVQDEASCVVYGMPRSVVEAGLADLVAPLDVLADRIAFKFARGVMA